MYPRSRPSVISASTFDWSFPFAFLDCALPFTRPAVALVILTFLAAGLRLAARLFLEIIFFLRVRFFCTRFFFACVERFFDFLILLLELLPYVESARL